jgi:RNA polymerase sigma-70 factor (ECF subfamily)
MPAESWALGLAVGWGPTNVEDERVEEVSEEQQGSEHAEGSNEALVAGFSLNQATWSRDPAWGRMAGQERRIDDTILIREAQRGNRGAFEELVRYYDQPVLRLALHLMGSDHEAQDVYQDAFLKAYKNIGSFRFECSFYTWIYRIVTNLCLDHLRKRNVRKEDAPVAKGGDGEEYDLLERVPDGRAGANPERDLMRRQLGARISGALEKLTPRERMVFELKHYHGMKLRTVGEILHTTEETAKNTLFRATQKLRGQLADMR